MIWFSEHQYKASAPGPENERTMIFYSEARVDGLVKRIETPTEMSEHFVDREDFLYYRFVEFGKRPKKFGPAENSTPRPIMVRCMGFLLSVKHFRLGAFDIICFAGMFQVWILSENTME